MALDCVGTHQRCGGDVVLTTTVNTGAVLVCLSCDAASGDPGFHVVPKPDLVAKIERERMGGRN